MNDDFIGDDQDYYDDGVPCIEMWYDVGLERGATHMVIAFDMAPEPNYDAAYVYPNGDSLERVQHKCEGGGHIFETIDLSKPLPKEIVERFYKYAF